MSMLPPRAGLYDYIFIEQLVKEINEHAKKQGYSITGGRGGRQRGGRGASETVAEGQNADVSASYIGSFQM